MHIYFVVFSSSRKFAEILHHTLWKNSYNGLKKSSLFLQIYEKRVSTKFYIVRFSLNWWSIWRSYVGIFREDCLYHVSVRLYIEFLATHNLVIHSVIQLVIGYWNIGYAIRKIISMSLSCLDLIAWILFVIVVCDTIISISIYNLNIL